MNKELKFRAWDEGKKIMHNNFQFISSGEADNDWILFISDKQLIGTDWKNNPYFRQQMHIQQFTGLKDRNDRDIYEGDILKYLDGDISHHRIFWDTVQCRWWDERLEDGDSATAYYGFDLFSDARVIGNIYENPELLTTQSL